MRELTEAELGFIPGGYASFTGGNKGNNDSVTYDGVTYTSDQWHDISFPNNASNSSSPFGNGGVETDGEWADMWSSWASSSSAAESRADDNYQAAQTQAASDDRWNALLSGLEQQPSSGSGTLFNSNWSYTFNQDTLETHLSASPVSSDEANSFADTHVLNLGTSFNDLVFAQRAHDDIARFYDNAMWNPGGTIDIGEGQTITNWQALQNITTGTSIVITDNLDNPAGNETNPRSSSAPDYDHATIYHNPDAGNSIGYVSKFGTTGIDYLVFHEIGHALNMFNNLPAFSDEAAANTAGRSLENGLSLPLLGQTSSNPQGVNPGYGYD